MFDDGAAPMPRNPRRIQNTGARITEEMKNWSLKDREQPVPRDAAPPKEGDTYAGPQSDVPFSVVSGLQPNAIRLGGKPRRRLDLRAPKWDFKDFREDNVLSIRQFQMAFRRLCLYSDQFGREDELDIKRTIHDTCQKAGILQVRYKKPRRNTIKVLLLIDCGGTMTPHHQLCSRLFQAVSRSNRFKDLKIYYFHNCIDEYLYTNPTLRLKYEVSAEKVFRKCDKDYKVILVGDGTMDINELINAPAVTTPNNKGFSGEDWLNYIRSRYRYTVWLTPILRPKDTFIGLWRESYDFIDNLFDMYPLTVGRPGPGHEKAYRPNVTGTRVFCTENPGREAKSHNPFPLYCLPPFFLLESNLSKKAVISAVCTDAVLRILYRRFPAIAWKTADLLTQ